VGFLARDKGREEPISKPHLRQATDFHAGIPKKNPLLVVGSGDPAGATNKVISALGGMKRFVHSGETVVVKPNIGWDRTPIQAANTNPIVVATVVDLCLKAGAKRVIVTDNPCNEARRCFTRSGIWKAAEEAGGEIVLPAKHRFAPYNLGGIILGRMPVLVPALKADRFINLPVAKHHGLSKFTGGMKNLYGVLGGRRNRLHQKIDDSIADLTSFVQPTLTIMDATRVLIRNGPQGGNVSDTLALGKIVASEDPVAVDAYACSFVNLSPSDIPYLSLAQQQGLGIDDLAKIEIREVS
jgi:uncharacterized protein (DUF362 family)